MKKYFLNDGQNQLGPFDINDLKFRDIKPDTNIWFDGLSDWTPAGQIEELNFLFSSVPTPTPPPIVKVQKIDSPSIQNKKSEKKYKIFWLIFGLICIILITLFLVHLSSSENEKALLKNQLSNTQQQLQAQANEQKKLEQEKQEQIAVATSRNMEYRNNWPKYVSVDIASFNPLSFGGFDNIVVNATNKTQFPLDLIVAEVTYWKSDGKIFKTEKVSIVDIPGNESRFVIAPSSPRGTSLTVEILKITAGKFNFCYDVDAVPTPDGKFYDNRNPNDPWKCGQ